MPSEKSARSSERRRIRNRGVRRATRTIVTSTLNTLQANGPEEAEPAIRQALSALDKAVRKGVLHANNAARRKSRIMAKVNALRGVS